jgi:hypothetical protein
VEAEGGAGGTRQRGSSGSRLMGVVVRLGLRFAGWDDAGA